MSKVFAFSVGMSRRRLLLPGFSYHVRHRGNNSSHVFRDDDDRHRFLDLFGTSAGENRVDINGYALMSTHFHAVVTPNAPDALPRMMQSFGSDYVRYFNRRHRRTGTLWEGRYWSSLIGTEYYWFTCLRYVEMNPVAARIVSGPEAYPWSSYRANAGGETNGLLTPHPLFLQLGPDAATRSAKWAALCREPISEPDLAEIRRAARRGTILGADCVERIQHVAGVVDSGIVSGARKELAAGL